MKLKPHQIEQAREMRLERGLPYRTIADHFGCAKKTIQDALNPDQKERSRLTKQALRLSRRIPRGNDEKTMEIPEATRRRWLERAIEFSMRKNPTAIICGDPLRDVCALYNADRR